MTCTGCNPSWSVRWPTRRLRPPSWKGLIGANQKLIAQAQGMLGGTQPGGDARAFQQILAAYTLSMGTVTLIEKCSGAVEFEAVATEHRWVVHISGGSLGRGDLTPDREAVGHLGSPFGRAEQMPSRPEVRGDAAEGGQEPAASMFKIL